LEKLSLSVMEGSGKGWEDEDVDAEGAQSESKLEIALDKRS
jgi:hypothetical protein